ncbi:UvrB/UvrC motif-containing protein [Savagea sp. SN6]|uniref:UvrB/UvrC motif-containing protein n=1 Tax=Savagea serpentis TaxID=2785297 RepID=A0A8J7KSU7_9BACL|nr:UvrB/UvrC motif-containing protein [Savagea serpentis]MBF4500934.1 UvrB/UvrC motif-containing protein [Savagea serpentis]
MLCDSCQAREATVFVTKETMDGRKEYQLCEKCAFESNEGKYSMQPQPMTMQQFLGNWFGQPETVSKVRPYQEASILCTNCQMSYEQFLKKGRFGCEQCYETFSEQLPNVFNKLHNGHERHIGKVPAYYPEAFALERKIKEVREQMNEAVKEERFEDAAMLRDEAIRLETQLSSGGDSNDN